MACGRSSYRWAVSQDRPFPDVVEMVVEIPSGSRNKYEWDERAQVFRLDRVLSSAVYYNFDYGYIAGTRSGDGDQTDALLLIDEPTFPGCHVWARPVGVCVDRTGALIVTDDAGNTIWRVSYTNTAPAHN